MKETVLVIGGSRFVGPYLLELLTKSGANVTVFNRGLVTTKYQNVSFVQGDRHTDFNLLKSKKFDVVYDMCAYRGQHTEKLLQEIQFDFLVHFGTVASYQLPITYPIRETHPQGVWFWGEYGSGKAECENILQKSGKKYASLRPTYILGANNYMNRERFIYDKLLKDQKFLVPGNGRALTQFVFVDEVAKSLFALGENKTEGAFNCVGDEYISLVTLLEEMGKIVGKSPQIEFDETHDRGAWDDAVFPFANENFLFDNAKISDQGIKFSPLIERLKKDWDEWYSKK